MSTGRAIGAVREIHRHPVKSMGGESIRETEIEKRFGVVGDRVWAIRDLTVGEIRGAKKIPALMTLGARYLEEPKDGASAPIEIDLGDGRWVRSDDAAVSERLSESLGRPVQLCSRPPAHDLAHDRRARPITDPETGIREAYELLPDEPTPKGMEGPVDFSVVTEYVSPPGTYFDFFDMHLLSTRSLERFAARVPDSIIEARNLRTAVESIGGRVEQIVSTNMYIVGMDAKKVEIFGRAMAVALDGKPFPANASTMIGVQSLAGEGMLVEISAFAIVD